MDEAVLRQRFPELFTRVRCGPVEAVFAPRKWLPPRSLIGNVNLVPFVDDATVVLRLPDGRPELPGGTLEPGEDYLAALRRELHEEAGALLHSFHLLGAWLCRSTATTPYRPHSPHPDFYRVVGAGEIALIGQPTNPLGGEQITAVDVVPVDAAAALFCEWQRPDVAALYLMAHHLQAARLTQATAVAEE